MTLADKALAALGRWSGSGSGDSGPATPGLMEGLGFCSIATYLLDTWLIDRGGSLQPDYRGSYDQRCRLLAPPCWRCRIDITHFFR